MINTFMQRLSSIDPVRAIGLGLQVGEGCQLVPDPEARTLRVRLHSMANWRSNRALRDPQLVCSLLSGHPLPPGPGPYCPIDFRAMSGARNLLLNLHSPRGVAGPRTHRVPVVPGGTQAPATGEDHGSGGRYGAGVHPSGR